MRELGRRSLPLLGCTLLLAAPGAAGAGEDLRPDRVQVVGAAGPAGDATWLEEAEEELEKPRSDPWEPLNRRVFAFNEALDRWVLEPVATGWDVVLPDPVEVRIGYAMDNLSMPIHFANDLLQAKPREAYETVWRFAINSTVGLAGFFDVASAWKVHHSDEDFGQTLGRWGTPSGPYLVLPLFGPSSPRDTAGLVVDSFANAYTYFVPFYVSLSVGTVNVVNKRALNLETIRAERESAFDFYTAVRSAYLQYRENRVRDRADDERHQAEDEDLYYFDDDEGADDE